MKRFAPVILALAILAAGCFPVLLDIDAQGRLLIPRSEGLFLYDTKTGKAQLLGRAATGSAAWARWSPDGQFILLCSTDEGKMSDLSVINAKTRQLKSYGTFSGAAAASTNSAVTSRPAGAGPSEAPPMVGSRRGPRTALGSNRKSLAHMRAL